MSNTGYQYWETDNSTIDLVLAFNIDPSKVLVPCPCLANIGIPILVQCWEPLLASNIDPNKVLVPSHVRPILDFQSCSNLGNQYWHPILIQAKSWYHAYVRPILDYQSWSNVGNQYWHSILIQARSWYYAHVWPILDFQSWSNVGNQYWYSILIQARSWYHTHVWPNWISNLGPMLGTTFGI